jgi:CubicO group peptidase (beta-lactamase class C family)
MSWKKTASLVSIVIVLLMMPVLPTQGFSIAQTDVVRDYWPTDEWSNTTPEEQGMNQYLLNDMMEYIDNIGLLIDSILIVRNGYLVFEEYPRFYNSETRHNIHSCTKSFTSALVGIAIEEGYIEGVDSKLVDLLPNRTIANLDERKQAITLEHLLTMTAGLEWDEWTEPYNSPLNSHYKMWFASDNVQYVLDLPMQYDPGERWVYCSGATNLIGAIITEATGTSLFDYAVEKLFTPLGISPADVFWPTDNQGLYWASGGVEMLPRDMAKFGYLYLNNGTWDDEQIVPKEWVQQSAATLRPFDILTGYSYQWWTYTNDIANSYTARGYQGQFIFVVPSLDMVVVFTSSVPPDESELQAWLLYDYIIPSAINKIPRQVMVTNAINLVVIGAIFLPIFYAVPKYKLRINNQFQELT